MNFIPNHNVGELGEWLVAKWLEAQGWSILNRRWRCPWGEIDIIAQQNLNIASPFLAFVEVKTRSRGNWDADGLLAITPQKQAKLWQTAQLFLSEKPHLVDIPCRFDVALVSCQRLRPNNLELSLSTEDLQASPVQLGKPLSVAGYQLILQDYLLSAFELS
ncbi:MAG: YraN family protein [Coleofasciculaceae cyanobacterium]